ARRLAGGVAWFDFSSICESARAAADYIEIARTHHTVLISRVPRLTREHEDAARRLINLVDEFYDRGVKLILAAEVPREQLYAGERLKLEFQRTLSRLIEMQSQEYLAKPHLP
ncbi:MAG: cell division protein ZapE, partial [Hydrocarboniphaga effusa]|nr:cell division protein ZapE [Hydrocarboniphaga effusa]